LREPEKRRTADETGAIHETDAVVVDRRAGAVAAVGLRPEAAGASLRVPSSGGARIGCVERLASIPESCSSSI
jgi:hypothetical protein